MVNKKAISPLIATVLIIGFTIVLAGITITFITNVFDTNLCSEGCKNEGSSVCFSATNFDVAATYNASATKTTVSIVNGNSAVMDFAVVFYDAAGASLNITESTGPITGYNSTTVTYTGEATDVKVIPKAQATYEDCECSVNCGEIEEAVVTV
jgi:flagellin-like protein